MGGYIKFGKIGYLPKSPFVKFESSSEATVDEIEKIVIGLSDELARKDGYVCYVLGMGARPRSIYRKIRNINGVQLIRYRSVISRIFSWLFPFVASYEGIVKIEKSYLLPHVFNLVAEASMAAVCCFSRNMEASILQSFLNSPRGKLYKNLLKEDPFYVMLLVDTDCPNSKTGVIKIVSYGVDAQDSLIAILHGNAPEIRSETL